MDLEKRLERAVERGNRTREEAGRRETERALTEEELRSLHTRVRVEVVDHVEKASRKVEDLLPGLEFSSVMSPDGWGGKVVQDRLAMSTGRSPTRLFSHMEILIKPFSSTHILEVIARGSIRNREILRRSHYQFLDQLDQESMCGLIDNWIVEYVEKFSAEK